MGVRTVIIKITNGKNLKSGSRGYTTIILKDIIVNNHDNQCLPSNISRYTSGYAYRTLFSCYSRSTVKERQKLQESVILRLKNSFSIQMNEKDIQIDFVKQSR